MLFLLCPSVFQPSLIVSTASFICVFLTVPKDDASVNIVSLTGFRRKIAEKHKQTIANTPRHTSAAKLQNRDQYCRKNRIIRNRGHGVPLVKHQSVSFRRVTSLRNCCTVLVHPLIDRLRRQRWMCNRLQLTLYI